LLVHGEGVTSPAALEDALRTAAQKGQLGPSAVVTTPCSQMHARKNQADDEMEIGELVVQTIHSDTVLVRLASLTMSHGVSHFQLSVASRAQILNLLVELKEQLDLTLVLISHDLRVVRYLCDRVAVMYLGQIVEVAPRDELFTNPRHPYTRVLLAASLTEESTADDLVHRLKGEPPSPIDVPTGCRFHPRCPMAQDLCHTDVPVVSAAGAEHTVSCHFWDQ
jgi:oligopeptide/dipeptide ABC transporter ATP-binding protein